MHSSTISFSSSTSLNFASASALNTVFLLFSPPPYLRHISKAERTALPLFLSD